MLLIDRRFHIVVLLLAWLVGAGAADAQVDWYVDDDAAGGDGTTWETAFVELQSALDAAQPSDVIHIAAGTYTPDYDVALGVHTGDRFATFHLLYDVAILGGYAGVTNPEPDVRDVDLYETILSGDLAGDDGPDFANIAENSYNVVTAHLTDLTSVLDGVTITAGNADGTQYPATCFGGENNEMPCLTEEHCPDGLCVSIYSTGGGLVSHGGGPALNDCTITANIALQGGGLMLKDGSAAVLTGCTLSNNRALDNGGAAYVGHSFVTWTNCQFINNSGKRYAGAICNRDLSNGPMTGCLFTGNTAAEEETTGGAAIVNAAASPHISDCVFDQNTAFIGKAGAIYNKLGFPPEYGSADPLIENCTFTSNFAASGGAIYNEHSSPIVSGCIFTANDATTGEGGGAMWNVGGGPLVSDSTFENNSGFNGGGLYNGEYSTAVIENCTFTGNSAINDNGGGLSNVECDDVQILGCTFIGNTATGEGFVVGGGVSNYLSNPFIADCTFTGNSAIFGGGGLYNESGGEGLGPQVHRCIFAGNSAPYGGGMYNFLSSPTVSNSLFYENEAVADGSGWGGGMYNDFLSSPVVSHCTFANNTADDGGGINTFNVSGSTMISHSILWGNSPQQIADDLDSPSTVSFSNVQGGWPGGVNVMDESPGFDDAAAGDYHLLPDSGCIDAGDVEYVPGPQEVDLDGMPRLADGDQDGLAVVDVGAYEFQPHCDGDIDGDSEVDVVDLLALIAAWGLNPGNPADLDEDGEVDVVDLLTLIAAWGPC